MSKLIAFGPASQKTKTSFIQTDINQLTDTNRHVRKNGVGNKLNCTEDPAGEALEGQVCNIP